MLKICSTVFLLALVAHAWAEDVWVLGSYANKANALAEQRRIQQLLGKPVFVIDHNNQGTFRVLVRQTDVSAITLANAHLETWSMSMTPSALESDPPPDVTKNTPQPGVTETNDVGGTSDSAIAQATGPSPSKAAYLRELKQGIPAPVSAIPPTTVPAPKVAPPQPSTPHTVVVSSSRKPAKKPPSGFVPPGFEDLMQPQTTLVDIYYGDAYLMSTTATFTPTWITFTQPADIIAKIPDLLDPKVVQEKLATELPTNTEFACLKANQGDCGKMETDSVDVIFDEGHFRADLFIAPQLLAVRPASQSKFLPPSSAGLSLLDAVSAAVNGQSRSSATYNIGNSTTIAYKENQLLAVSNITRQDHLTFDTLALQREINGRQFQAGIFRSSPGDFVFIHQEDFEGVSIASSLNTRKDLDQSSGNDLQVFLDSRSRVDILKDGRLVSTAVYDTGNQIIDTSQLPGGAYDIVLRIRDSAGNVREETRFYVKTSRLPPKDQTLFFFDAGELAQRQAGDALPSGTGQQILRGGATKRLTDNFGAEIGALKSDKQSLFETGFFQLGRSYDLRVSYAHDNLGDDGASLNARARLGRIVLNVNARKVWSAVPLGTDSLLGPAVTQTAENLTIPFGRATFNLTSRLNKRADLGTDRNVGMRFDFPTYNAGDHMFDSNLQVTKNNGDLLVLATFRLTLRQQHWQNQISASYYDDRPEVAPSTHGVIGNVSSSWSDGDIFLSDVDLTMRANRERSDRTLETELNVASDSGRYNVDGVYSMDSRRLNYGANAFTNIIANKDTVTFGGRSQAQSAVVLDIEGDVKDAYFDVDVNGLKRGNAQIGAKTLLGLAPFQTYKVGLVPQGKSLVDFNNDIRTTTLYPGNVVTLQWKTKKILVAFGQIVDEDKKPIANALIEGVVGLATTDDFGLFQAELDTTTTSLHIRTRASSCNVSLPKYDTNQMVVTLNELVCR